MVFDIKTDLRVQYKFSGTWFSIQADTYSVDIDRGITVEQGVFAKPDIGIATIKLSKQSLSDLMTAPAYKSNQPFRIQYFNGSTWAYLFYGIIQNVSIAYVSESKKLDITITANDLMKILLNTRLTNFILSGTVAARSFRNAMNALGTAVRAVDNRIQLVQYGSGGSATTQWGWEWNDTTAGEILTQFLDAELGWCYSANNEDDIKYLTRNDIGSLQATSWDASALTISNQHSTSSNHVCMDQIDLTYDSDSIVNKVKATETLFGDISTMANSTSIANYGEQAADFEVTFDNTGISTLGTWASSVSQASNYPKSIKMVSVPIIRDDGNPSTIANIEVATPIQVKFAASGYTSLQEIYLISRIGHTITSEHWEVNLGLWRGI
jgi:hypothetical protein